MDRTPDVFIPPPSDVRGRKDKSSVVFPGAVTVDYKQGGRSGGPPTPLLGRAAGGPEESPTDPAPKSDFRSLPSWRPQVHDQAAGLGQAPQTPCSWRAMGLCSPRPHGGFSVRVWAPMPSSDKTAGPVPSLQPLESLNLPPSPPSRPRLQIQSHSGGLGQGFNVWIWGRGHTEPAAPPTKV